MRHATTFIALAGALFLIATAEAATALSARVTGIVGKVQERTTALPSWHPSDLQDLILPGEAIRTGRKSRAQLTYEDGSITRLASTTVLHLRESEQGFLRLLFGKIYMHVTSQHAPMMLKVPAGAAAILGTEFLLSVEPQDISHMTVLEGKVEMTGSLGDKVIVKAGQWVELRPGQPMDPPSNFDWTVLRKTEPLLRPDGVDEGFEPMPWK